MTDPRTKEPRRHTDMIRSRIGDLLLGALVSMAIGAVTVGAKLARIEEQIIAIQKDVQRIDSRKP